MNSETPLEHQIKILEALLAKKPVEFRPKVGQHMFRRLDPDNTWFIHWDQFEFRLPPKIVKKRVPCIPADFPPGTVITRTTWGNTARASVLYVDADVIAYFSPSTRATMTPFSELVMLDFFRSLDGGKTWLPSYRLTDEVTEG